MNVSYKVILMICISCFSYNMALPHTHVILLCASHKSCQVILSYHNNSHQRNNNYLTHAEIHGESSKAYRMTLSPFEQNILMNIQLDVMLFGRFSQTWSHIFINNAPALSLELHLNYSIGPTEITASVRISLIMLNCYFFFFHWDGVRYAEQ